jgi:NAD(P)-dependent dehydrogenase (short-subunit alcohol dehydrogenase family)
MAAVLLITGSSRGIGATTAKLAASRGFAVCINYVTNRERAEAVRGDIERAGGRAIVAQGDAGVEADIMRLFETVDRELGPVTALVNNAGIIGRAGRLEDLTPEAIRRVIEVNLVGTILCAREAVRRMSTKHGGQGGAIVNVSSIAGIIGGANQWLHYAAAKGGINTFTVGLAREVGPEGIRVNAVAPGLIDTEIHAEAGVADRLQKVVPQVPMQRIGTPQEVAEAIVWLLSGEAAYLTGAVIPMAGGR